MNTKNNYKTSSLTNKLHSKIKVFFIDLDGTLLDIKKNNTHQVSVANKNAIRKFVDTGRHVIISTGRIGDLAFKHISSLGLDYMICGNGAQILNKEHEVIKEWKLKSEQAEKIIKFCQENNLAVKLDNVSFAYGINPKNIVRTKIAKYFSLKPVSGYKIDLVKTLKITIWGKFKFSMVDIEKKLNAAVPQLNTCLMARGWVIEVTNENASKGKAANYIVDNFLKISDQHEVAHIGDSLNDASSAAEGLFLIAMKNSDQKLFEYATHLGPHYMDGGVAKVLKGQYVDIS